VQADRRQAELLPDVDDLGDLLDRVGDEFLPEDRWPQTLADMVDVLMAIAKRQGKDEQTAFRECRQSVVALSHYLGGRPIYLPKGDAINRALRDEEIFREANRNNIDLIAERHGFSRRAIEKIVARQTALHRRKLQGRLFDD
jgi:Mor family transcriptional regulator